MKNLFQKENVTNVKKKAITSLMAVVTAIGALAPACFAETESTTSIATSTAEVISAGMTESAAEVQTVAVNMIGDIWPYVLGIMVAFIIFKFGKKFFKQIGK